MHGGMGRWRLRSTWIRVFRVLEHVTGLEIGLRPLCACEATGAT